MVPTGPRPRKHRRPAPRARGDGPRGGAGRRHGGVCSPRTRGWSSCHHCTRSSGALLPAHAGMVLREACTTATIGPAPRARGDGPYSASSSKSTRACSPRTRGWSRTPRALGLPRVLLPAHAGMVHSRFGSLSPEIPAPRARGDGPHGGRDCSLRLPCSPRTRGWSVHRVGDRIAGDLLPAHAGMVRPDRAGDSRRAAAPRARGDGPAAATASVARSSCSPRTRGWSHVGLPRPVPVALLPAHAGMVLSHLTVKTPATCSPRTRGWSRRLPARRHRLQLLPAHAGMVRSRSVASGTWPSAPRARGDGPSQTGPLTSRRRCSPRTRGWS